MNFRYIICLAGALALAHSTTSPAGSVHGATCFESKALAAGDVVFYEAEMRPEEPARVTVVGDGALRVDLRVIDRYGKVVCDADEVSDAGRSCRWMAADRGPYRILVTELDGHTPYRVCTN
jgi:hypothetical protein